ncbi:MFS transporter [Streptomyces otsuchiensis]|uniref:MFS transporter n=1 Tax=Streptomyces otsuchiensis TaxID=2681388 RepID=UPI0010310137|nr:MFS transporter [Streptomyces otsuchiensis]
MVSAAPALLPIRRWRLSLFVFMLLVGVSMSSWIVRTPAVRDALQASTAQMGLVLLGLSVGSMSGILSSAAMVRRHGGRTTMAVGGVLVVAGVLVVGLGSAAASAPLVALGLGLFGGGGGLSEIAVNIEGADIERRLERPVLPALHGCFSAGTVVGALAGIVLTYLRVPVVLHLGVVSALAAVAFAWSVRSIPPGTGRQSLDAGSGAGWRAQLVVWRDRRIVLLGMVVLALALAEGSANDWLPLIMVDGHGTTQTTGSIVFAAFAAAMTCGRFMGATLLNRFGPVLVLRGSALVSVAGLALVVFSPNSAVAGAAVVLWGLGASLGFPVTISAAGDSDDPDAAVAAVATAGYLAFLAGPPVLGFVGEHVGLRGAMLLVLVVVATVTVTSAAARPRAGAASADGGDGAPEPVGERPKVS